MIIRGGSLASVALMLACWCPSLSAQLSRPDATTPPQELPAIDDPGASADKEAEQPSQESFSFALSAAEDFELPSGSWTDRVVGIPGPELVEKRGVPGLPTFTRTIGVQRKNYRFTMVGSDPYLARSGRVVVPLQIIPIRLVFNDGTVLDPTNPLPGCAGPGTPLANTLQSPLFTDTDYGEGNRQYVEENRRVEFWALAGRNPGYSVRVAPIVLPTMTLTFSGPSVELPCGRMGVGPKDPLNTLIQSTLIPELRRQGVSPKTFPLFLFFNFVTTEPNQPGFILGYHSSIGAQTYGVAEYDTSQKFSGVEDISALAHELAEWYDDPFVNNATPPWGHIGQVAGCQSNLEVGDPLSGQFFQITMPNGLTYHPQQLASFSWFFDQVPSLGYKGFYSWGGAFTTPASLCR
jgi:hypothetical protein